MFKPNTLCAILMSIVCLYTMPAFAVTPAVGKPAVTSLAPMLETVMPSIVNVKIQGVVPAMITMPGDDSKSGPRFNKPRKFEGYASGVIIDANKGYILTNAHVVKDVKVITVTLSDGRRIKAKLIGADRSTDIAVLQIKAKHLKALPQADSNKVRVGDFVVAIGNPFGLGRLGGTNQTATFGTVSALQRTEVIPNSMEDFIQTDAAINPGNSGGALVNMEGQLIGINTGIITPSGGNIGIGFAIPINMARSVMQQLIKYGSVARGLMGVFVQQLTPELAEAFDIPSQKGALVTQVNEGSPAAQAGLKAGDVIQRINGQQIDAAAQVKNTIGLLRVGSKVSMTLLRNGKTIKLEAKVADIKRHQAELQAKNPFLFGLALRSFEEQIPLHGEVVGAQIIGATETSAGWRAGLRPGDVIISANKQVVRSLKDLTRIAAQSKSQLLTHVIRGPGSLFVVIR